MLMITKKKAHIQIERKIPHYINFKIINENTASENKHLKPYLRVVVCHRRTSGVFYHGYYFSNNGN